MTLQLQVPPELAPFARRRGSMDGYTGGGGGGGGTGMTVAGFAAMREAVWPQPPRQSPTSHDAHDLNLALSMHHQQQHQQQMQAMQGHAQRHGGLGGGSPRVIPSPFSRAADFAGPETAAPQPMALPPLTLGLEPDGSGGRQHQQQGLRVDLNTTLPPQQQSPMPAEAAGHIGGGQQHHQQQQQGGVSQAGEGSGDPAASMLLPSAEQRQTGDWLRAAGWARGPPPEPAPPPLLSPSSGSGSRLASQQPAMSPQLTLARPSQSQSPSGSLLSPAPSLGDKPATPHDNNPDAGSMMSTPPQPGSAGGGSSRGGAAGDPAATSSPEFSERLRQMSLQYYKIEPASLPPDLQSSLLEVLQVIFVVTSSLAPTTRRPLLSAVALFSLLLTAIEPCQVQTWTLPMPATLLCDMISKGSRSQVMPPKQGGPPDADSRSLQVEDAAGSDQPHIGAAPSSGGLDERLF